VIRAYNDCGNNFTDVDLLDLLAWVEAHCRNGEISPWRVPALFPPQRN
jgi:hypothetical protein